MTTVAIHWPPARKVKKKNRGSGQGSIDCSEGEDYANI
jgi:hypothetical protein